MNKSVGQFMREYAALIREAESQPDGFAGDMPEPVPTENVPDESLMGEEDKITDIDQLQDPVAELADSIGVDQTKIQAWLKDNNYELSPVGGLSNKQGNV